MRSVRSIVIAPASTGRESRSRKLVMSTDHTNRGTLSISRPGPRIFRIVVRKLIEPARLLTPDRWRLKMATSTAPATSGWVLSEGNGK